MAPVFTGNYFGFGKGPSGPTVFVPDISATGGSKSSPGDGYTYHTSVSTLTVASGTADVECVIIGAGGGGGGSDGGGGATGGGGGTVIATVTMTGPFAISSGTGGGGGGAQGNKNDAQGGPSGPNGGGQGGRGGPQGHSGPGFIFLDQMFTYLLLAVVAVEVVPTKVVLTILDLLVVEIPQT